MTCHPERSEGSCATIPSHPERSAGGAGAKSKDLGPSRKLSHILLVVFVATPSPLAHCHHYHGHLLPDPRFTPGEIATTDTSLLCAANYTARPGVRHVSGNLKRLTYALYAVRRTDSTVIPPLRIVGVIPRDSICCEIDHLVSLELGGGNAPSNLWPEPYSDATAKDLVENGLHWLVCHGRLPIGVAQKGIAGNWVRFRDSLVRAGNWVSWGVESGR